MAKIRIKIERDPEQQLPWARNFLNAKKIQVHWAKKTADVPAIVNAIVKQAEPFEPPVQLLYTTKHYWSFCWDTEAEQTMFIMKWLPEGK